MTGTRRLPVAAEPWTEHAACRGHQRDLWFPERGDIPAMRQARTICNTCPVRPDCLAYALRTFTNSTDHGIWGGTNADERRTIRRNRKPASPPPRPALAAVGAAGSRRRQ